MAYHVTHHKGVRTGVSTQEREPLEWRANGTFLLCPHSDSMGETFVWSVNSDRSDNAQWHCKATR